MIKKCIGCGAVLQDHDEKELGYVSNINNPICKRCFRIKNYGEYISANKSYLDYLKLFDEIKKKDDLVLFLCDILSLDESLNKINEFNCKVILVITKCDLLPKSVKEFKLKNYIINNYKLNIVDIIFVSAVKNYNIDLLLNKVYKNRNSNYVYLVGNTNSGKSTLINKIIKNVRLLPGDITTSSMPATTLDLIEIKVYDDLVLIDTPGIVSTNNYLTDLNYKDIKIISPKVTIKPITYQMKPKQSILIGNYARIDYLSEHSNSFTLYLSNNINLNRISLNTNNTLRNLAKKSFNLKSGKDIVINGLCFCKIVKDAKVDIYVKNNVDVFERNNLI